MSVPVPLCYSCVYLTGEGMTCAAYPSGIPAEILDSDVDHRLPYAGDHGIHFMQDPAKPEPDLTVFEGPSS